MRSFYTTQWTSDQPGIHETVSEPLSSKGGKRWHSGLLGKLSWMLPASSTQAAVWPVHRASVILSPYSYFTVTLMRCSSHGGKCLLGHSPTGRSQYHDDLECWGCKKGRASLRLPNQEEALWAQKDPWLAWLPGIEAWQAGHPIQGWPCRIHVASSRDRGSKCTWGPVSRACSETWL